MRGASHKLALLAEGGKNSAAGVVAASAGNHAQAVARAARRYDVPVTVVMPTTAPMTKVAACRALGATIEQIGTTLEEATDRAHELDRKSTRLNSSHVAISYAVFCLKKKKT